MAFVQGRIQPKLSHHRSLTEATNGSGHPKNRRDMQEQAIETNNTVLAALLQMCGQPVIHTHNEYDADKIKLSKRKARELHRDGVPGKVRYFFNVTDEAVAIIKAFDEQKRNISIKRYVNIEASEEDVARIVATYADTAKIVGKMWQKTSSMVRQNTGEKSFSLVSMNASAETLEHLS